jgi:hypothetical protein
MAATRMVAAVELPVRVVLDGEPVLVTLPGVPWLTHVAAQSRTFALRLASHRENSAYRG